MSVMVLNPKKKIYVIWEVYVSLIYFVCYMIDPFVFAYACQPLIIYPFIT